MRDDDVHMVEDERRLPSNQGLSRVCWPDGSIAVLPADTTLTGAVAGAALEAWAQFSGAERMGTAEGAPRLPSAEQAA